MVHSSCFWEAGPLASRGLRCIWDKYSIGMVCIIAMCPNASCLPPCIQVGNLVFLSARPHVYKDMSEAKSYAKFKKLQVGQVCRTHETVLIDIPQSGAFCVTLGGRWCLFNPECLDYNVQANPLSPTNLSTEWMLGSILSRAVCTCRLCSVWEYVWSQISP